MIGSLTQLLNHYATRVSITMQAHPKGAQLTISIMPCPNKIKDEALRQQLIQPIVLVGDNDALSTQVKALENSLSMATENPVINQSVLEYNVSLNNATGNSKATEKAPSKPQKATPTATASTSSTAQPEVPSAASNALDAMFI